MQQLKFKGSIGRWTAEADGQTLPVLQDTWWDGSTGYHDPMKDNVKGHWKKYREYVSLLSSTSQAILQRDEKPGLRRKSYIGVFEICEVRIEPDLQVTLRVGRQIAAPLS